MTLTAMRPDSGRSNGRETWLWSDAQASASISTVPGGLRFAISPSTVVPPPPASRARG